MSKIFLSKSKSSALLSFKSSTIISSVLAFLHNSPQHLLQSFIQSIRFFLHEHNAVPTWVFWGHMEQHLTTYRNHSGAESASVLIGIIRPFSSFHPHCLVSNTVKLRYFHWQTWSWSIIECYQNTWTVDGVLVQIASSFISTVF